MRVQLECEAINLGFHHLTQLFTSIISTEKHNLVNTWTMRLCPCFDEGVN